MKLHKLSIVCSLMLFVSTVVSAKIVFQSNRDGNSEIYVMNDDGTQVQRLTNNPLYDAIPMWSPDGRTIAFMRDLYSAGVGKGQQYDLFIMKADGSNQRNLTDHPALDVKPSWSPDGRHLAFTSSRSGRWEIHIMDILSGSVKQLTDSAKRDGYAGSPDWSPNGKQIAYELALRGQGRHIYIMDADGKNAKPLTKAAQLLIPGQAIMRFAPLWSPDGQQILYIESTFAKDQGKVRVISDKLFVCHSDGSKLRKLPIPKGWEITTACWAADGTDIFFAAIENGLVKPGGNFEIYRYNRVNRQITNLTNHPRGDVSPDWLGQNFSVSPVRKLSTRWGDIKRKAVTEGSSIP